MEFKKRLIGWLWGLGSLLGLTIVTYIVEIIPEMELPAFLAAIALLALEQVTKYLNKARQAKHSKYL